MKSPTNARHKEKKERIETGLVYEIKKEKQEIRLKPLSNPQPSTISKGARAGIPDQPKR